MAKYTYQSGYHVYITHANNLYVYTDFAKYNNKMFVRC